GVAELDELDAADRALAVGDADLLALLRLRGAALGPGRLLLRLVQGLVGALPTHGQLPVLGVAAPFRGVPSGGLRTLLALHRRAPENGPRPGAISSAILTGGGMLSRRACGGAAWE